MHTKFRLNRSPDHDFRIHTEPVHDDLFKATDIEFQKWRRNIATFQRKNLVHPVGNDCFNKIAIALKEF